MHTQVRASKSSPTTKFARTLITAILTLAIGATGLSTASADTDPIAGDFDFAGLTATADGNAKAVTITPKNGKSAGTITVYYGDGTTTTAPSAAGTYAITFDVAAATGYNAVTGLSAGNLVISAAVVVPAVTVSSGYSAAEAAAIRAANEAAAKAEAEKIAKAKAEADAKAAAEAAAKAAADKAALEKAAAEREAADNAAAEVRAAAEAVVKAEEARVAAAEEKAAAVEVKPVVTKSGTKLTLDLPDKYYGKIVTIFVGTTVKGKTTYKKLDYFVLDKEDGTANFSTKMKFKKGQTIQVKVGSKVVKSVRL